MTRRPSSRSSLAPRFRRNIASGRRGLTLLEVLLSLAVFMASLAAISQIASQGMAVASQVQWESEAAIRAEGQMNAVLCGVLPMQAANGTFEDNTQWEWNLATGVDPLHPDLLRLEMQVSHLNSGGKPTYTFLLARSVRSPEVYVAAAAAAEAAASAAATSSSSSSTTQGATQ